jgi:hypothetical protein
MVVYLIIIGAAASFAASPGAGEHRHVVAKRFLHEPCGPLSGKPCIPSMCGAFHHGACLYDFDYPYSENLQVTIQSQPSQHDAARYRKPDHDLNTIGDLFAALRSCWSPPPADAAREGMQMSVLFSFRKSGSIIAPPRITFVTRGAPADARDTYLKTINASLSGCAPFKFTAGLGGAIAGRPIMIRYVENRELEKRSGAE